jgi:hypothetical protein
MKSEHPFNEDLKSVLDTDEAYNFLPSETWMEGGCTLLALALQKLVVDSQIYSIGRLNEGIPDHTVLQVIVYGEPFYIDYDGLHTSDELKEKVIHEWGFHNPQLAPANMELLNEMGLLHLSHSAVPLSKDIFRSLGEINEDRLSPEWAEAAPTLGGLR